ncbi:MAG TPA: acetate/propionate family kinase [Halioglobus sp.]
MNSGSFLVVNAGSSSLKFSLFRLDAADTLQLAARGLVDGIGAEPHMRVKNDTGETLFERKLPIADACDLGRAITLAGAWLRDYFPHEPLLAVGHRVVHGGAEYSHPLRVDQSILTALEKLIPLAPLHQPHNLAAIRSLLDIQPQLPQIACFDTAFHRTHPQLADMYALPFEYYEAGVRRYGFHGLSYEYIAATLPQVAPDIANGRVIVAHLGSGASLCALRAGKSVDSTMGFSALDGIPMGTRPGAVDPGVLLYLVSQRHMTPAALETLLYKESGLLGLSGISNDMRQLLASPEPRARLAIDYFIHNIAKAIGALTAVLGGLDGLVFTAGIGENSPEIRARIIEACGWLGITLNANANRRCEPRISTTGSAASAWVIPTNEELMIATHTHALVKAASLPDVR